MTNQEWLSTLSPEEFYDAWRFAMINYGRWDVDTRLGMIEWLKAEHDEKRFKIRGF